MCGDRILNILQYNNDIDQVLANDLGNYLKVGHRQRLLGTLLVKYWALSNSPPPGLV